MGSLMGVYVEDWRDDAACLGAPVEVFFPSGKGTGEERWDAARAYCARCTVRSQCLSMALKIQEHDDRWGFFGGYTPSERTGIRAGYVKVQ